MTHISAGAEIAEGSYENLLPVISFLERQGNAPVTDGFIDSQGGFYCAMSEALDFAALIDEFDFDSRIVLDRTSDTILDKSTWVAIYGAESPNLR